MRWCVLHDQYVTTQHLSGRRITDKRDHMTTYKQNFYGKKMKRFFLIVVLNLTTINYAIGNGMWLQKTGPWLYEPPTAYISGPNRIAIVGGIGLSCKTPNWIYLLQASEYREIFKNAVWCPSTFNDFATYPHNFVGNIQYAWAVAAGEIYIEDGKSGYKNTGSTQITTDDMTTPGHGETSVIAGAVDRKGTYRPGTLYLKISTTYPDGAQRAFLRIGNGISDSSTPVVTTLDNNNSQNVILDYIVHNGIVYPSGYNVPTCTITPLEINVDHGVLSIHTATNHEASVNIQISCTGKATGIVRVVGLNATTMKERLMTHIQKMDEWVDVPLNGGGRSNLQIRHGSTRGTIIPFNVSNGSITLDVTSELRDVTTPGVKRGQAILSVTYQ